MDVLLLLTIVFGLALLVCGIILIGRIQRINKLETMLNEAGNEAAKNKRSLESSQNAHKSENERLQQTESELSNLRKEISNVRKELESCNHSAAEKEKQIVEMSAQIEAFEPTRQRARDAEDKLLALQKESAALRNESKQAFKRVEAAESAARDKQIQFERIEASLEAKDKALLAKQKESGDLARELDERRTEISELVVERDKLTSMEATLKEKLRESEGSSKENERARQQLNDQFTECRLELGDTKEQLTRLKQMFDEQVATGATDGEQIKKLRDQLLETEGKLSRKEAALKDLELTHADSTRETPYEAHRHMDWTINHFDPKAITFKFNNVGAKIFLVDVETSVPQLRYEFETGRELPRAEDFEARLKLAIKKSEQKNMEELPGEFDMTVFYALNIYPIQFKIRPREGQRIERIK